MKKLEYNKPTTYTFVIDNEQEILAGSTTISIDSDPAGDTSNATMGDNTHNSADGKDNDNFEEW